MLLRFKENFQFCVLSVRQFIPNVINHTYIISARIYLNTRAWVDSCVIQFEDMNYTQEIMQFETKNFSGY